MRLRSTSTKHLPSALTFAALLSVTGCSLDVDYLRAESSATDARGDSNASDGRPADAVSNDVPLDGEAGAPRDASGDGDSSRLEADVGPIKVICADAAPPCSSPAMIADMENDDGNSCNSQGRSGQWVASGDGTSTNFAPAFGPLATFDPLPACRDTSA